MLLSLDTKKANGRDSISARMLKSTAPSIAYGITLLFNKSISTGRIPRAWKVSSIVPVPKGSDSTSYRPISLLPAVSKLLERHMHYLISHHIEMFFPIVSNQWNFQPCPNWCCSSLVSGTWPKKRGSYSLLWSPQSLWFCTSQAPAGQTYTYWLKYIPY